MKNAKLKETNNKDSKNSMAKLLKKFLTFIRGEKKKLLRKKYKNFLYIKNIDVNMIKPNFIFLIFL